MQGLSDKKKQETTRAASPSHAKGTGISASLNNPAQHLIHHESAYPQEFDFHYDNHDSAATVFMIRSNLHGSFFHNTSGALIGKKKKDSWLHCIL